MSAYLLFQGADPPTQLFESYVAMLVRERVDDVFDFKRASGQ